MLRNWTHRCLRSGTVAVAASLVVAGSANAEANFRLIHVSTNAGTVDTCANGTGANPIDYRDPEFLAGYFPSPLESFIAGIFETGTDCGSTAIALLAVNVAADSFSSVVIADVEATTDSQIILIADDLTPPAAGKAKIRLMNMSPGAGSLDLTPTSEADGGTPLINDVAYGTASAYIEVDADTPIALDVRDAASSLPALIPDDVEGSPIPEGFVITVLVVGIEGDINFPLEIESLIDLPGEGGGEGEGEVGTSQVRVVHASPSSGAIEVCEDGSVVDASRAYFSVEAFAEVASGTIEYAVFPPESNCTGTSLGTESLVAEPFGVYTIVVTDTPVKGFAAELLQLEGDLFLPGAGQSRIRFIHASAGAPTVDLSLQESALGSPAVFEDVAFGAQGNAENIASGQYSFELRDAANTTSVVQLDPVVLEEDRVYTIFAIGILGDETNPLELVVVDDLDGTIVTPLLPEGEGEGTVEGEGEGAIEGEGEGTSEGEGEGTTEGEGEGEDDPSDPDFVQLFDEFIAGDTDENDLLTLDEILVLNASFDTGKFNAADLDGSGDLTRGEVDLAKAPLDLCGTMNDIVSVVDSEVLGPLLAELGDDLDILFQLECTGSEDLNGPFPEAEGEGESTSILPGPNGIPDGNFEFGVLAELINNSELYTDLVTGTLTGQVQAGADPAALAIALASNNTLILNIVGPFADTAVLTALLPLLIDFAEPPFNFTPPFNSPEEVEVISGIVSEFQKLFPGISRLVASYATLGDDDSIGVVLAVATLINDLLLDNGLEEIIGLLPTEGYITSNGILGLNGDADGDGCTQIEEFADFGGTAETYIAAVLNPETVAVACGVVEGEGEGGTEGEGEGSPEGDGEVEPVRHDADTDDDGIVDLSGLLRAVQFYNAGGYFCTDDVESEDGYGLVDDGIAFGTGNCVTHDADFLEGNDGEVILSELLRLIQLFNLATELVESLSTEDGWDIVL
jgi:hypothetical protein